MRVNVTEDTFRVEQVIRVIQPSILTSGVYTCKVATFTSEQITSHNLLIFGKLLSKSLQYFSLFLSILEVCVFSREVSKVQEEICLDKVVIEY